MHFDFKPENEDRLDRLEKSLILLASASAFVVTGGRLASSPAAFIFYRAARANSLTEKNEHSKPS